MPNRCLVISEVINSMSNPSLIHLLTFVVQVFSVSTSHHCWSWIVIIFFNIFYNSSFRVNGAFLGQIFFDDKEAWIKIRGTFATYAHKTTNTLCINLMFCCNCSISHQDDWTKFNLSDNPWEKICCRDLNPRPSESCLLARALISS